MASPLQYPPKLIAMKSTIQCPHCHSKKVSTGSKIVQIGIGIALTAIGAGFFVFAVSGVVGYYLFALPLLSVGTINTAKGYYSDQAHAHCTNCHTQFEYLAEQ